MGAAACARRRNPAPPLSARAVSAAGISGLAQHPVAATPRGALASATVRCPFVQSLLLDQLLPASPRLHVARRAPSEVSLSASSGVRPRIAVHSARRQHAAAGAGSACCSAPIEASAQGLCITRTKAGCNQGRSSSSSPPIEPCRANASRPRACSTALQAGGSAAIVIGGFGFGGTLRRLRVQHRIAEPVGQIAGAAALAFGRRWLALAFAGCPPGI